MGDEFLDSSIDCNEIPRIDLSESFPDDLIDDFFMVDPRTQMPHEQPQNEPNINHDDNEEAAQENMAVGTVANVDTETWYTPVDGNSNYCQNSGNFEDSYFMGTNINTGNTPDDPNVVLTPTSYDNMLNQDQDQNPSCMEENRKFGRTSSRASSGASDQGYGSKESSPTYQPTQVTGNEAPDLPAAPLPSQIIYSPLLKPASTIQQSDVLESMPGPLTACPEAGKPSSSRTKSGKITKLNKVNLINV